MGSCGASLADCKATKWAKKPVPPPEQLQEIIHHKRLDFSSSIRPLEVTQQDDEPLVGTSAKFGQWLGLHRRTGKYSSQSFSPNPHHNSSQLFQSSNADSTNDFTDSRAHWQYPVITVGAKSDSTKDPVGHLGRRELSAVTGNGSANSEHARMRITDGARDTDKIVENSNSVIKREGNTFESKAEPESKRKRNPESRNISDIPASTEQASRYLDASGKTKLHNTTIHGNEAHAEMSISLQNELWRPPTKVIPHGLVKQSPIIIEPGFHITESIAPTKQLLTTKTLTGSSENSKSSKRIHSRLHPIQEKIEQIYRNVSRRARRNTSTAGNLIKVTSSTSTRLLMARGMIPLPIPPSQSHDNSMNSGCSPFTTINPYTVTASGWKYTHPELEAKSLETHRLQRSEGSQKFQFPGIMQKQRLVKTDTDESRSNFYSPSSLYFHGGQNPEIWSGNNSPLAFTGSYYPPQPMQVYGFHSNHNYYQPVVKPHNISHSDRHNDRHNHRKSFRSKTSFASASSSSFTNRSREKQSVSFGKHRSRHGVRSEPGEHDLQREDRKRRRYENHLRKSHSRGSSTESIKGCKPPARTFNTPAHFVAAYKQGSDSEPLSDESGSSSSLASSLDPSSSVIKNERKKIHPPKKLAKSSSTKLPPKKIALKKKIIKPPVETLKPPKRPETISVEEPESSPAEPKKSVELPQNHEHSEGRTSVDTGILSQNSAKIQRGSIRRSIQEPNLKSATSGPFSSKAQFDVASQIQKAAVESEGCNTFQSIGNPRSLLFKRYANSKTGINRSSSCSPARGRRRRSRSGSRKSREKSCDLCKFCYGNGCCYCDFTQSLGCPPPFPMSMLCAPGCFGYPGAAQSAFTIPSMHGSVLPMTNPYTAYPIPFQPGQCASVQFPQPFSSPVGNVALFMVQRQDEDVRGYPPKGSGIGTGNCEQCPSLSSPYLRINKPEMLIGNNSFYPPQETYHKSYDEQMDFPDNFQSQCAGPKDIDCRGSGYLPDFRCGFSGLPYGNPLMYCCYRDVRCPRKKACAPKKKKKMKSLEVPRTERPPCLPERTRNCVEQIPLCLPERVGRCVEELSQKFYGNSCYCEDHCSPCCYENFQCDIS